MNRLKFLHLSDLHFKAETTDTTFDHHSDARAKVIDTVAREVYRSGAFSGILVTGDIAFSGKAKDYSFPKRWLYDVVKAAQCDVSQVRCIPGNHDVDRDVATSDPMLRDAIESVRATIPADEATKRFEDYVKNSSERMFASFCDYNAFAKEFQSTTEGPNAVVWHTDFDLNDTSTLRLLGLNTAIVCTKDDDENPHRVMLGRFQLNWPIDSQIACVTLCHHNPETLKDWVSVQGQWLDKARVIICGHTHQSRIRKIDNCLLINGGALHPDEIRDSRSFNVIEIWVKSEEHKRDLMITVSSHDWDSTKNEFVPKPPETHELKLPTTPPEKVSMLIGMTLTSVEEKEATTDVNAMIDREEKAAEALVTDFINIDDDRREALVTKFGLAHADDDSLTAGDRFIQIFKRASAKKVLKDFLVAISKELRG